MYMKIHTSMGDRCMLGTCFSSICDEVLPITSIRERVIYLRAEGQHHVGVSGPGCTGFFWNGEATEDLPLLHRKDKQK